jgi:hypothetical protein
MDSRFKRIQLGKGVADLEAVFIRASAKMPLSSIADAQC